MKKNNPLISVVIPALNEESKIEKTLCSLRSQTIKNSQVEIIVVDNGSTDNTVTIAKKLADKVLIKRNCTVGAARNHGAQFAKSDILVCTDADCEFDKNWLENGLKLIKNSKNTAFGGGLKSSDDKKNWVEEYWILNPSGNSIQQKDLMGSCIFIKKEIFTSVSGFDENITSGEDSDISDRLRMSGTSISISPQLSVIHRGSPRTLYSFIKRQVWHSENYIKNFKKSAKDKVFYLTTIYLASCILLITGLLIESKTLSFASLTLILLTPAILSFKRIKRSKFKVSNINELAKIYTLDQFYIIGRCIGLIKGLARPIHTSKIKDV